MYSIARNCHTDLTAIMEKTDLITQPTYHVIAINQAMMERGLLPLGVFDTDGFSFSLP